MPIYTYQCQSCSDTLERRQSFSDDPLTTHDECGGSLRRIIHPAGIVFKGSGFYNTDYKNATPTNKPADTAAAETKPADTAASDSSTSTSASSGDAASTTTSSPPAAASSTPAATTP